MIHWPLHIKQQDWEQAFGAEISGIFVVNKIISDWSSLDTIDRSLLTPRQPKRSRNYCAETLYVVPILFVVYKVANSCYYS